MSETEHDIQNKIRLAVGKAQAGVLFRANVGVGWNGEVINQSQNRLVLSNPHRLSTGLPNGFPDLFGYRKTKITEDMVGKEIAVFAFLEVKTKKGKPTEAQKRMHEFLKKDGAIGGIARSPEEALKLLNVM